MDYLEPLIKKTVEAEFASDAYNADSDEGILKALLKHTDFQTVSQAFHDRYAFELVNLDNFKEVGNVKEFKWDLLEASSVIPYKYIANEKEWVFAISDISNEHILTVFTEIAREKGASASFVFALKYQIDNFYASHKPKEGEKPIELTSNKPSEWVDLVLKKGLMLEASDIHIEPLENGYRVRYRVDGDLVEKQDFTLSETKISNIVVRLKVVAGMNITEKRRSQDGRIDGYELNGVKYSMRVSSVNTILGEKFVLRILDETSATKSFSELGFFEKQIQALERLLSNSNGIVYLAGATGSGKTTTLYSMIESLDKSKLNIYTVENPVEKRLSGISQIPVDEQSQNTYPSVLKTLLRQDPDVIVIGEIRESETANIAIEASLTGHLVMTTLHSNNALDSVIRLSQMDIESYLLGASSVGFLSQRLVKRLCEFCKEKVETLPVYEEMWLKKHKPGFDYEEEKAKGNYIYITECDWYHSSGANISV